VRQPVNDRGLGRWRTYAQDLTPLIDELHGCGAYNFDDIGSDAVLASDSRLPTKP